LVDTLLVADVEVREPSRRHPPRARLVFITTDDQPGKSSARGE
jgi:hypothetical protein